MSCVSRSILLPTGAPNASQISNLALDLDGLRLDLGLNLRASVLGIFTRHPLEISYYVKHLNWLLKIFSLGVQVSPGPDGESGQFG